MRRSYPFLHGSDCSGLWDALAASIFAGEVGDVEAAVGMHSIELVKPLRQIGIERQQFGKQMLAPIPFDRHVVEEIGAQSTGSP